MSLVAQPIISTSWEAEAGGLQLQGQPGKLSENLSQSKKRAGLYLEVECPSSQGPLVQLPVIGKKVKSSEFQTIQCKRKLSLPPLLG